MYHILGFVELWTRKSLSRRGLKFNYIHLLCLWFEKIGLFRLDLEALFDANMPLFNKITTILLYSFTYLNFTLKPQALNRYYLTLLLDDEA